LERCFVLLKQNFGKSRNEKKMEERSVKTKPRYFFKKSYLALSFRKSVGVIPLCTSW